MPTDLTKITGSVPYVTVSDPTANPVEYVSEFVPLTAKEGDVLLNLSDGAYYVVDVAGSGTQATLVRGDAQAALVQTAEPPYGIDGLAPYTAITDLYPSWSGDTVSYFDTRENPQTLFDYEDFANNQYAMVFNTLELPFADTGDAHADLLANAQTWKDALADPNSRVWIEQWIRQGGLLTLALNGDGVYSDTEWFDTNVALEESGIAWSSDLAQDAYNRTGRYPQRGPADYLVVPNASVVDPSITNIDDLNASAYMPAKTTYVIVGNSDRNGQEAVPFDGMVPTAEVPVYSRDEWINVYATINPDDQNFSVWWNGSSWSLD